MLYNVNLMYDDGLSYGEKSIVWKLITCVCEQLVLSYFHTFITKINTRYIWYWLINIFTIDFFYVYV